MDITSFLKLDSKKIIKINTQYSPETNSEETDKGIEGSELINKCSDAVKNEIIELDEFSDCIEYFKRGGGIVGIKRFLKIINKIVEKNSSIIQDVLNKFGEYVILNDNKFKSITSVELLKKFKKNKNIKYSIDQRLGAKSLFNFLLSDIKKCFGLYGFAGTGKTTLIVQLVDFLLNKNLVKSVAFTAPTNKAVNIMKSKFRNQLKLLIEKMTGQKELNNDIHFDSYLHSLESLGINIEFITTHRLLNYKTEFDEEGKRVFVKGKNTEIMSYDIVFIDECSMVSTELITHIFEDISREIKNSKNSIRKIPKVIFVGDPAQLPPVNEDTSIIFNKDIDLKTFKNNYKNVDIPTDELLKQYKKVKKELKNMNSYTLEKIVRSDNDKIIGLCNNIRNYVVGNTNKPKMGLFIDKVNKKVLIYKSQKNKLESHWFNMFMKDRKNNFDSCIILTWTNEQTDNYNKQVRELTVKNRDKKYNVDDILIIKDFYNFDENKDNSNDSGKFYTSEQIKVVSLKELTKVSSIFNCNLDKKIKMKSLIPIEAKYKETIIKINNNTKRKYNVFSLGCVKLSSIDNNVRNIYVIKDTSEKDLEEDKQYVSDEIRKLRQFYEIFYTEQIKQIDRHIIKPLWKEFSSIFVEPYANVTLGNSITCHTAQGSTYRKAYIDAEDILKNKNINDAKRCMYTALTRASDAVYIII